MEGRLKGKTCIITGTGGSMGRAAALQFCAAGARVVGCDIHVERAEETLAAVRQQGGDMVSLHPCDLTRQEDCDALVRLAQSTYGGFDVVYNNAAKAYFGWIDEISPADFMRTINEELFIVFLLCQTAWPHLVERGGGSIVNVASAAAKVAYKVLPGIAHSAAKGGVLAMTRQLAMEGAKHNIRANTISPGFTLSYQTRAHIAEDPEFWGPMKDKLMLGRAGEPEEIAPAAIFLASDESSFITGADIPVDGGTTAW
jgi:NAD(P)-dependent dehydrogenase (short-subunit alcohol dehydrogenase family)